MPVRAPAVAATIATTTTAVAGPSRAASATNLSFGVPSRNSAAAALEFAPASRHGVESSARGAAAPATVERQMGVPATMGYGGHGAGACAIIRSLRTGRTFPWFVLRAHAAASEPCTPPGGNCGRTSLRTSA